MYNLLVSGSGWAANGRDMFPANRAFEFTEMPLVDRFRPDGNLDLNELMRLPTLFVEEGRRDQIARVGTITQARIVADNLVLEYTFDAAVPAVSNSALESFAIDLDIADEFEFHRTHWAVKDVDLYRALLRNALPRRRQPTVFRLAEVESVEPTLVAVMMPFDASFNAVYATLQRSAEAVRLRCRRADEIWENPAIIQDVVSLIDRAAVVVCDCTGRNANVFYEIGIAHTLGREVILLTQAEADIPFDLRHLRYIQYLNNGEGLERLFGEVRARLSDLMN